MQSTSLSKVLGYAKKRYPGESQQELTSRINMVRQVLWKSPEKRELVFRVDGNEAVQRCTDYGQSGCFRHFTAITVPVNVTNVEHLEVQGHRIPIESDPLQNMPIGWNPGHHRATAYVLPVKTVFQHDIPLANRGPVCFWAESPEDTNKRVGVEYVTTGGNIVREDILLSTSGPETTQRPLYFLKATLPDRVGWVKVKTADGFLLGSYHPSITSPRHLRVQINGLCWGRVVKWIGMREPSDVLFESDEVEISSELDWQANFIWTDLHLKTTKSAEEMQTYQAVATFDAAQASSDLKAAQGTPSITLRPRSSKTMFQRIRGLQPPFLGRGWRGW